MAARGYARPPGFGLREPAVAKTGHDKTVIERQIDATNRQIDRLVYELYELTDEEIRIVEESAK